MTISKGSAWGQPLEGPRPTVAVDSDAAAADAYASGVRRLTISDGDLLRTLGLVAETIRDEPWEFPVDVGHVEFDGSEPQPFVAHVVAWRRWWSGDGVVVCNAAWWGPYYLGPRSHPNDGLLDATQGSLDWRARRQAPRRARSGAHLPHPSLRTVRSDRIDVELARPRPVVADGRVLGIGSRLRFTIIADALTIVA